MLLRLGSRARVAGRAARNVLLSRGLARRVAAVRDARFAAVTEQDRAFFRSLLGPSGETLPAPARPCASPHARGDEQAWWKTRLRSLL
jgi:hypothetical protein